MLVIRRLAWLESEALEEPSLRNYGRIKWITAREKLDVPSICSFVAHIRRRQSTGRGRSYDLWNGAE